MLDHQASQRVGPLLGDGSWKNNTWSLEKSMHRTVNLRNSELFFVSKQIIVCVRHNVVPAERDCQRLATVSTATLWGNEIKPDPASLQALSSVGQETADYMSAEFRGRYSVILSTPELAQILWDGPIHLVQESPFEPAPLQESVMLLLHLERYLVSSPDNVVLFFQGNLAVIAALIALQDPGAMNCDSAALLADLCVLRRESLPVAGARRYLAMLDACMNSPELIESSPRIVVTSIRLFGDHEFVRSSETLIRVHAELHHSGVIDSTDYREQMCYRITRGSEAEACLVISFLPIKLSVPFPSRRLPPPCSLVPPHRLRPPCGLRQPPPCLMSPAVIPKFACAGVSQHCGGGAGGAGGRAGDRVQHAGERDGAHHGAQAHAAGAATPRQAAYTRP
jgi:hypothetical protein